MILKGVLTVKCPKTDESIEVVRVCVECKRFKHISWKGLTPYIACEG